MLNPKQLRILFIDDENLEVVNLLKKQGYDVEHWYDVENLDLLTDGRYHFVFIDVRGIGEKFGGNGLNVLKYIHIHNPLIFTVVFSAKPFTGAESDLIRIHSKRSMTKDSTFYEVVEVIEGHAKGLTPDSIIAELQRTMKLGFWSRWKIRRGHQLSPASIERLAKASSISSDAIKIVTHTTAIAASLIKLFSGGAL